MKFNMRTYLSISFFVGLIFTSCTTDSDVMNSEELKVSNATAINPADLIGSWDLSKMLADSAVDLDKNGSSSTNLLDETTCFNTMSITFEEGGAFNSNNATMTFEGGESLDQFRCLDDRQDKGYWKVENNELVLMMLFDGDTITHRKPLDMTSNTFSFDVNRLESEQYVTDPGNTSASNIRILELEYTRR